MSLSITISFILPRSRERKHSRIVSMESVPANQDNSSVNNVLLGCVVAATLYFGISSNKVESKVEALSSKVDSKVEALSSKIDFLSSQQATMGSRLDGLIIGAGITTVVLSGATNVIKILEYFESREKSEKKNP